MFVLKKNLFDSTEYLFGPKIFCLNKKKKKTFQTNYFLSPNQIFFLSVISCRRWSLTGSFCLATWLANLPTACRLLVFSTIVCIVSPCNFCHYLVEYIILLSGASSILLPDLRSCYPFISHFGVTCAL